MQKVSIIIPARNEESTIGFVLDEINRSIAGNTDYSFEVIVGLDHCSDRTQELANEKGALVYPNLSSPGKGNAIRAALKGSSGDIIVMLDADGSHDPKDLGIILKALDNGCSLVVGSRALGGSDEYEIVRLFGNAFFTLLVCSLFKVRLTDSLNGYKAFRRDMLNVGNLRSSGFEIEIELLYNALIFKASVGEIASHERKRMGGRMKSRTFFDGMRFLKAIVKWGIRYRVNSLLHIKQAPR
jgi:glycosyltransferase involved in cell wall biosynthesis